MTYKDILCDANNLYRAYLASIKTSSWKESSQKFELNYLRGIFNIKNKLLSRTMTNGEITEFIYRERGRVRPITSLFIDDRIVRHVLCDDILLPKVKQKIIYDNGASIKGRGVSFQRKRFEVHLRKFYKLYGNEGWIIFGDFRKFYDNIVHEIAKRELLKLVEFDEFMDWLFTMIFDGFKVDASDMSEQEINEAMDGVFDKVEYRKNFKSSKGIKFLPKSVNIGDQLSQIIGVYFPHRIDSYIKYVRHQKFYGRYMDDWYVISPSKSELIDILNSVHVIADELEIHINKKKTRIEKISNTVVFLQIKYRLSKNGKIIKRLKSNKVTAFRRKLRKLATKVNNGEVPYYNVENMYKGWMGNFYKYLSRSQRDNLIKLFEELFHKSIEINKKKMIITEGRLFKE